MTLTSYRITFETLGPVHIGSGKTLNQSEYLFERSTSLIHVINGRKLVSYLNKHNKLEHFIAYCNNRNFINLYSYISNQKIKRDDWDEFIDYSIPVHKADKDRLNDVQTFIRDGQNDVYVPGSSIKGVLRSILVGDKRDSNTNKRFNKIKISDSTPLSHLDFIIYQKTDVNKTDKTLPLYRESIEVGQKFEVLLTVEDKVLSIDELQKKIANHYRNYYDKYLSGFRNTDGGKEFFEPGNLLDTYAPHKESQVVFLGGGVGFADKTIYYQKYDQHTARRKSFDQLKRRPQYRKMKNMPNNVPIVLKAAKNKINQALYLQGACKVKIEKMEGE